MNFSSKNYSSIVLFTGAGMSAESGVPTYRGRVVFGTNTNGRNMPAKMLLIKIQKKF